MGTYQHIWNLNEASPTQPTFVAVGMFDGVHRGHQALLQQMVQEAKAMGVRTAVLTFFPHPLTVIRGLKGRIYLCSLEERVKRLAELDIDLIITHPFNEQVRFTRASEFADQLVRLLDMRQIWGGSFTLGYNREGTAEFLSRLGETRGFAVRSIDDLLFVGGERVSSSRTRHRLRQGDVQDAAFCLGRPYQLSGVVVHGSHRGRMIGFPTANLAVWEEQILPANGVYAAYAEVNGERLACAVNIGVRPTVDGEHFTIEAHLLDYAGTLYGQTINLDFIAHIREEHKFANLDALVAQIGADVAQVRHILMNDNRLTL